MIRILAALALLLLPALPVRAEEAILRFLQSIEVRADDTLLVTEEITVRAEGDQIRRGIYRDFPTVFVDGDGRRRQVPFEVVEVLRNGAPEPYRVNRGGDGARVYIGEEDVFIPTGNHVYRLTYETGRQIRRFDDHDELFWNVTGNDWAFPIRQAEARVFLPEGARETSATAYTGYFGARGTDWRIDRGVAGADLVFSATRPLQAGEGLSIVVALPKGVIAEPTGADELGWFWLENAPSVIAGAGLGLVLVYYGVAWARVGRDPPRGVVVPQWDPPSGISAPLAQYVHERGLSGGGWTAMAAAWVALAVRGLVTLDTSEKDLAIARTEAKIPPSLPASEKELVDWIEGRGGLAVINRAVGRSVQSLASDFRGAVRTESRETFFENNRGFAFLGIALSAGAMVLAAVFSIAPEETIGSLMPLIFAGAFGSVGVNGVLTAVRAHDWRSRIGGAVLGLVALGAASTGLLGAIAIGGIDGSLPTLPLIGLALVAVNVLFFHLLAAPTVNGRKLMDRIEGLILYMTVAEEQRLNMAGLPPVTPSRYETLLPYAVALGVEEPWTEALEANLARSAAAGAAASYEPAWYHGRAGRSFGTDLARGVSSMAGSFQSSVPPPKSSSSGFSSSSGSGGGGGGGGGGGW